jgi:hypothetical protein
MSELTRIINEAFTAAADSGMPAALHSPERDSPNKVPKFRDPPCKTPHNNF